MYTFIKNSMVVLELFNNFIFFGTVKVQKFLIIVKFSDISFFLFNSFTSCAFIDKFLLFFLKLINHKNSRVSMEYLTIIYLQVPFYWTGEFVCEL